MISEIIFFAVGAAIIIIGLVLFHRGWREENEN
jgi:uncharacterized membrane protein